MIPDENILSERDFCFLRERIQWLDNEITRYRDFEWKATRFHAAYFIALIYILLDPQRRSQVLCLKYWLSLSVIIYLIIAVFQLVYMHRKLNLSRNDRSDKLRRLGEPAGPKIAFYSLWEGAGAIFPLGFIISLFFLATAVLYFLGFFPVQ